MLKVVTCKKYCLWDINLTVLELQAFFSVVADIFFTAVYFNFNWLFYCKKCLYHKCLKGALQWSIYPQWTGSIHRRKWHLLLSSPCMLVLILLTSDGWKAEWTLAGKKVAKYSTLGRTGNGTRDLRAGRQILPLRQPRLFHILQEIFQI